jgi:hypothetical protein
MGLRLVFSLRVCDHLICSLVPISLEKLHSDKVFSLISGVNKKQHNSLKEDRDFYSFQGNGKFVWKESEGTNCRVSNVCSI